MVPDACCPRGCLSPPFFLDSRHSTAPTVGRRSLRGFGCYLDILIVGPTEKVFEALSFIRAKGKLIAQDPPYDRKWAP